MKIIRPYLLVLTALSVLLPLSAQCADTASVSPMPAIAATYQANGSTSYVSTNTRENSAKSRYGAFAFKSPTDIDQEANGRQFWE
jgi:hypothetical protein